MSIEGFRGWFKRGKGRVGQRKDRPGRTLSATGEYYAAGLGNRELAGKGFEGAKVVRSTKRGQGASRKYERERTVDDEASKSSGVSFRAPDGVAMGEKRKKTKDEAQQQCDKDLRGGVEKTRAQGNLRQMLLRTLAAVQGGGLSKRPGSKKGAED